VMQAHHSVGYAPFWQDDANFAPSCANVAQMGSRQTVPLAWLHFRDHARVTDGQRNPVGRRSDLNRFVLMPRQPPIQIA
jgi:hypothetical protein